MNLIKRLKAKAIGKAALLSVLLLLVAAIPLMASECWLFFAEPVNLYDVPRDELEGKYVTIDLEMIYGAYAYTEQYQNNVATGNITAMEYIIDANIYDYCGMLVEDDDLIAQADELLDQITAYDNFEIDEITAGFTVTGVMKQMPSDSLEYYHEAVDYDSWSAEDQETFLPLYLDVRGSDDVVTSVVFLILALLMLALGLFILIQAISGKHQKQILAKAKEINPSAPELVLDQMEQLYEMQNKSKALKMDSRLIFAQAGAFSNLYPANELVWAYHAVTTQRVNFIPVGKSHSLVLAMADGKKLTIPMKKDAVMEWLQTIQQLNRNCFLGYNDALDKLYRKDPKAVLQLKATQMDSIQQ